MRDEKIQCFQKMINAFLRNVVVRGLFIARFQPIHRGHVRVIREIMEKVDELLIAVAAAQISHTRKNPLTAGERLIMVREALKDANIPLDRIWIIPVQDILDNALWVFHLKRILPPFDIMFSNNPFTVNLFKEAGLKTQGTGIYDRMHFSATSIREGIINDEPIDNYLYPSTVHYLKKWNIKDRLLSIVTDEVKLAKSGKEAGTELTKDL